MPRFVAQNTSFTLAHSLPSGVGRRSVCNPPTPACHHLGHVHQAYDTLYAIAELNPDADQIQGTSRMEGHT